MMWHGLVEVVPMKAALAAIVGVALAAVSSAVPASVVPAPSPSLAVRAAQLPLYQPIAFVRGEPVAIDTGGVTAVERSRFTNLTTAHVMEILGRPVHALIAPDGYLQHWYLTSELRASAGPTWLREGGVTFDFAKGNVSTHSLASVVALPDSVKAPYLFVKLTIGDERHTCLFDTGAVGRISQATRGSALQAVNLLEGSSFDRLAVAHPSWRRPGTMVTIAEEHGTDEAPMLIAPALQSDAIVFRDVEFVRRREKGSFGELSRKLNAKVDCDVGGAMFRERLVQLDLKRGALSVSRKAAE